MKDYQEKIIECEFYDLEDGEFRFMRKKKLIFFIFAEHVISIELITSVPIDTSIA